MMTGWWLGSTQDYKILNVLQSNNKLTLRQKGCVFINVLTTNATHCLSSPQNLAHSDTEFVPPISFKLPVIYIAAESRVKHPGKKTTQNITHTECLYSPWLFDSKTYSQQSISRCLISPPKDLGNIDIPYFQ